MIDKKQKRIQQRKDFPLPDKEKIDYLAKTLARQIDREILRKRYAPVADVLKLVGAGVFIAASIAVPNLPKALKPFLSDPSEERAWKRFNIHYLKRSLERLEKQKLVEVGVDDSGCQIVKITDSGRRKILRCALDELEIRKPKNWDGTWRLVSYDLPTKTGWVRNIFREYLRRWGFYPLHKSVFLHAYPCFKEVEFLREYLGIGKYVRIFKVAKIENDSIFKEFFSLEI